MARRALAASVAILALAGTPSATATALTTEDRFELAQHHYRHQP